MNTVVPGGEQMLPGLEDPSAVLRMLLGSRLRRFREAAGITPEEAAYEIRGSRSKISRMETGRVGFKNHDVTDLLAMYGVTDEQPRSRFLSLVSRPDSRTGGRGTGTSCPAGPRPTSGSSPLRRPSAAPRASSSR